jgi:hypothetical protein
MNAWLVGEGCKEIRDFLGVAMFPGSGPSLSYDETGVKSEEGELSRSRKFSVKVSRQLRIHVQ